MDSWKICILGDSDVGKKSLAKQFALNCWVDVYDPTLEEESFRKQLVVDNRMCLLEIFVADHGEEAVMFSSDSHLIRYSQGFIIAYSVASRQTFERVETYLESVRSAKDNPVVMIVGNKCDETLGRQVTKEEGAALAGKLQCQLIETSAKTAQNVDRLFVNLIRALRQARDSQLLSSKAEKLNTKGNLRRRRTKCVVM